MSALSCGMQASLRVWRTARLSGVPMMPATTFEPPSMSFDTAPGVRSFEYWSSSMSVVIFTSPRRPFELA